jgi:hypothetical protein
MTASPPKAAMSDAEDRFWSKVRIGDGCWLWTASVCRFGYGRFHTTPHGVQKAHRMSWTFARGPISDGLWVLHNCPDGDNPACVRPSHLFLGTHRDNMADMVAKGRQSTYPRRRGSDHPSARLTADKVVEIRTRYARGGVTHAILAAEYGVAEPTIGAVICGRLWKHVTRHGEPQEDPR